jgi:hypothetical protein
VIAVYAFAKGPITAPLGSGVQREALRAIAMSGLMVIAGEVAAACQVSREALAAHDRAVRRVEARAVLPVRFAAVAADLPALRRFVRERRTELTAALARVAGCEQFTLRVFPSRRARTRPAPGEGPGAAWLRARSPLPPQIAPLREAVAALVKDERAEAGDGVASVYHLVARADRRAYRAALARGLRAVSGTRVVVSGPWPAYAFTEAV